MLGFLLLSALLAAGAFALAALLASRRQPEDWWMLGYNEGFRDGHELGVMESNTTGEEVA